MKAFNTTKISNTDKTLEVQLLDLASKVNTNETANQTAHENLASQMTSTVTAVNLFKSQVDEINDGFKDEIETFETTTDAKIANIQAAATQAVTTADNVSLELETTNAQVSSIINTLEEEELTKETINADTVNSEIVTASVVNVGTLNVEESFGDITTNNITMNGNLYKGNLTLIPFDLNNQDTPTVFKFTNFNLGRATLTLYLSRNGTTALISTMAIEMSGFNNGNATIDDTVRLFKSQYTYNSNLYIELNFPTWSLETDRYYYSIQFMNTLPTVSVVAQNGLDFETDDADTSYHMETGTCNWFFGNHTDDYITRINGAMRADTFVIDTISGDSISSLNTLVVEHAQLVESVFDVDGIILKSGDYNETIIPDEGITFNYTKTTEEGEKVDVPVTSINSEGLNADIATFASATVENLTIAGDEITWKDIEYSLAMATEDLTWVRH